MEKSATVRRQRTPAQPRRPRTNSRAGHVGTIPPTTTTTTMTPHPPMHSLSADCPAEQPAVGLRRSSSASAVVSQTSLMCFCCCCRYCSRNCLDCTAIPEEETATISPIQRVGVPRGTGLAAFKGARKRPRLMSKCWHWMMVLLLVALITAATRLFPCPSSLSHSGENASRKSCNTNGGGREGAMVETATFKMRPLEENWGQDLGNEGEGEIVNRGGREYLYNYSHSYQHIGQLDGGGNGVGGEEGRGRVGQVVGTGGSCRRMGSGSSSRRRVRSRRRGNNESDDSWGVKDPPAATTKATTKQQCNLLQRILDSGINSIQFIKSQFARHLCNTISGHLVRINGGEEGNVDADEMHMESDMNNLVVRRGNGEAADGRGIDPKDCNEDPSYPVQVVRIFSDNPRRTFRHRLKLLGDEHSPADEQKDQILNQSVLDKESIPIHLASRLIRRDIMDNEDNLEASDNLEYGHFSFLRKLQFIEEDAEEEDNDPGFEETDENQEELESNTRTLEKELQAIERDSQPESDTPSIDPFGAGQSAAVVEDSDLELPTSRLVGSPITSIRALEEDLELRLEDQPSFESTNLGDNLENTPKNHSLLKNLQLFLDRIRPSPLAKRAARSPFADKYNADTHTPPESQLLQLEQRLRIGLKQDKKVGKGNKCKLNGKSGSCRRRNGAQRKANTQKPVGGGAQQTTKNKWPPTTTKNIVANMQFTSGGGEKSKSSGDKWKFILENFCAKSHLHGQLPKLIAKLEQQQQQRQDYRKAAATPQQQQLGKQEHGQPAANKEVLGSANAPQVDDDNDDEEDEEDELTAAARTTDSLRLEVIKEQILKKLGLKQKPNITNIWTAAAGHAASSTSRSGSSPSTSSSPVATSIGGGPPVDATADDEGSDDVYDAGGQGTSSNSSSGGIAGSRRRMVEKKTANFMFGTGPTGIQLPNNNSQFFIHDGHTRPMDQELFLSKELILATLYRAQLDSVGHHHEARPPPPHDNTDPSSGTAHNRLFDDLHVDSGARRRRRKGRKRKGKAGGAAAATEWPEGDSGEKEEEEEYDGWGDNDQQRDGINSEDLKSHTRRYLDEDFGADDEDEEDFDEEDAFHERNHRYQWQNNQQDDDGQTGDEDSFGQSREIITFAERGKLLNGRQHLLEFKPVGDHRSPGGGDFRIRSAVLWLKVEHLKQARESHQREGGNHDGGGGGRNITIWVFNMKTPGWESKVDGDCPLNYASAAKTVNGEKVDRNCPTSEGFSSNYESMRNGRIEDEDGAGSLELNLNEKDFNRVSELTLTHTIHLNPRDGMPSPSYDYHNNKFDSNKQKYRGSGGKPEQDEEMNFASTISSDHSPLSSNGWHKFDITAVVRQWNNVNRSQRPVNLQLLVDCTGCRRTGVHVHLFHGKLWNQQHQPPPLANENRPFLVAHTHPNTMKRVRRRALDCSGSQSGRCCKQRFYVSFKALGWDDWIIAPHGYFANYCRGSCAYRTADMLPTPYSKFINEFRKLGKMAEMQPCCAPLKFSSMSLIYFDQERNIIKRDLPKMVVDECGCP